MRGEPTSIKGSYKITPKGNQKLSRYGYLRRMVNEDDRVFIETPVKLNIRESSNDTFFAVTSGYENRLDLISYKFYNTPFLWWVIAEVNNIDNPLIVDVGVVLRIPSLSELYSPTGILTALRGEY